MGKAFQELKEQAVRFFSLDTGSELFAGFMMGLMVFGLLILAALFLYWIFHSPRHVRGITLQGERGSVFISARSISDLIGSLEKEFPGIEIVRVGLFSRRNEPYLEAHLEYQPSENSALPSLLDSFQKRALSELESSFGITSVREIRIRIDRVHPPHTSAI